MEYIGYEGLIWRLSGLFGLILIGFLFWSEVSMIEGGQLMLILMLILFFAFIQSILLFAESSGYCKYILYKLSDDSLKGEK